MLLLFSKFANGLRLFCHHKKIKELIHAVRINIWQLCDFSILIRKLAKKFLSYYETYCRLLNLFLILKIIKNATEGRRGLELPIFIHFQLTSWN
jgi:hypothetical protein